MYSIVDLSGSNGQSNFTFSFSYLSQDHIHVYVDGVETTDFSFSSAFVVTLDTPLSGSHTVRVQRITPIDEPVVNFSNGSVLGETDLDYSGLQLLYSQQEIDDAFDNTLQKDDDDLWDAEDTRIINVGEPTQPTDAATKEYVDGALAGSSLGHSLSAHNDVDNSMVHAKGDLLAYNATTSEWEKVAVGTDGQTLEADSSDDKGVSWKQGVRKLVTATGDMIYATASGILARLAIGAANTILVSSGTAPGWQNETTVVALLTAALKAAGLAPSTGDAKLTLKTTADSGWILMDDGTIGDASSAASTRANADCEALFTLLWNNVSDTYAPVVTGRGASAAADFAAHKKITLTKQLGRALLIAGAGSGLTSRALGQTGGSENAVNVSHTHTATVTDPGHTHGGTYLRVINTAIATSGPGNVDSSTLPSATTGITVGISTDGVSGTGANMQPYGAWNIMVKL